MDPDALGVAPFRIAWIPGTHILAFNTRQVVEGPGLSIYNDLRFVDVDRAELTTFLAPGSGGEFIISPDGRQIAISGATTTPNAISLINVDGSNLRSNLVVYDSVLTYSEYAYYARPVWSAGSDSLLVTIPPVDSLIMPRHPTTIWYIPTDGSSWNDDRPGDHFPVVRF